MGKKKTAVEMVAVDRFEFEHCRKMVRPLVEFHLEKRARLVPLGRTEGPGGSPHLRPPDEMDLAAAVYRQALRDAVSLLTERFPEHMAAMLDHPPAGGVPAPTPSTP
jgi:hypothetical protein